MENDSLSFGYKKIKLSAGWEWQGEAIQACTAPVFAFTNIACKMKNNECWTFQLVEIFLFGFNHIFKVLWKSIALNL